ncbi:hypothetical protein DFP73DRAFT_13018 [Morchella snyderi]|nr:hypothetical protein DFP73DRAFT_13018 [Morchella snyderi]
MSPSSRSFFSLNFYIDTFLYLMLPFTLSGYCYHTIPTISFTTILSPLINSYLFLYILLFFSLCIFCHDRGLLGRLWWWENYRKKNSFLLYVSVPCMLHCYLFSCLYYSALSI